MEFEWDNEKRQSNLQKHGIDFIRACQIFEGETVDFEQNRFAQSPSKICDLDGVSETSK